MFLSEIKEKESGVTNVDQVDAANMWKRYRYIQKLHAGLRKTFFIEYLDSWNMLKNVKLFQKQFTLAKLHL